MNLRFTSLSSLCFMLTMTFVSVMAQDTLFTTILENRYNGSMYDNTAGTASIVQEGDSFKLYLHEDFTTAQAPDVHIFFAKQLAPSDEVGNDHIDFYTFPNNDISGAYTFALTSDHIGALDSLTFITFECVRFGNILFGGGEWMPAMSDTTDPGDTSTVSVANQKLDAALNIYPIPASSELNIDLTDNVQLTGIEMLDVSGRVISSYGGQTNSINVQHLPSATYVLRFRSKKGGVVTKPFVVGQ